MRSFLRLSALLLAVGCSTSSTVAESTSPTSTTPAQASPPVGFPPPPPVPTGETPGATEAWQQYISRVSNGVMDQDSTGMLSEVSDARHAWVVADLLRFLNGTAVQDDLESVFEAVTGVSMVELDAVPWSWGPVTDALIAWDLPAPPDYLELKSQLFTVVEPRWSPFFDDTDADIDWRWVSWGGVRIDDRPLGDPDPCARGCIPSLDNPELVAAADGDYYPEDRIVFGIVHGGEAVAFPKNVMEVHEMVNLTIGGERIGIPYCTLCGSVQAFLTDRVPDGVETPVLRTSGLLSRSNKVMYDLVTMSIFDTFTGRARSGPLHDRGVTLEQITVTVAPWGEWRRAHPDTRIVAEDGGIGRDYPDDPLAGRDDEGPIFPIGDVDPRLGVQARVLGVITGSGDAVAFDADVARRTLDSGREVTLGGVSLGLEAGGLRAFDADGVELAAHEAFWFAWSQFHEGTALWTGP